MSHRIDDEYEEGVVEEEEFSASDDNDEGLNEDLADLARACMVPGPIDADEIPKEDPLLLAAEALIPLTDSDDNTCDLECLRRVQDLYCPQSTLLPLPSASDDDDDEDDLETARSVLQRYSSYNQGGLGTLGEEHQTANLGCEGDNANGSIPHNPNTGESCPVSQCPNEGIDSLAEGIEIQYRDVVENYISDVGKSSELPPKSRSCHSETMALVDAINKNRSFQRFLRTKMTDLEAKIEESKKIADKFKLLNDFRISCNRRTANALSLKKDPRVQLISAAKTSCATSNSQRSKEKISPMCYGPAENSRVANNKKALERFPVSFDRKKWSDVERENLSKGIKQQFQEMVLQNSVDRTSPECLSGDANDMDDIIAAVKNLEITPEMIRDFLPKVEWDRLASMHLAGRTGAECQSRWLNCEDPLINQGPWTSEEDRSLLLLVQNMGIRNWFGIAASLGTNRTPFQCLARYQRSLNPSMLNSEWTKEEDTQLCAAVALYGESDWQSVASVLERRTGNQCSNRWRKSLCPERKGSFTPEEDTLLTVAVKLFGHKWNQIAKYVPGRSQSQCRERYRNSLDPSLKWGGWTEEEDSRLEAAIAKHGHCWSKVAQDVPPRTDSQCRKRWKVLHPEHVSLLHEARKMQKSILARNFVDRESERPALTLNDFLPSHMLASPSAAGTLNLPLKRKRRSRKTRSKRQAEKAQIPPKEVEDVVCSGGVKTCIESSESQDLDDMTLACFLKNKSKKGRVKGTRNVKQGSFSCRTKAVSKLVENQIPSGEQEWLSQSCDTGGAIDLFMQQNVASQEPVIKVTDADTLKQDDSKTLTDNDDDMTLVCFLGSKSKKLSQAAKGRPCTSSKLKNRSVLLREVHCASKPTISADDSGSSMSKLVEEESVLDHGLTEPTNNDVEEDDDLLASFLQNKSK